MSAVDDLTELVECAAAAERAALASKWKERSDVEALSQRVRRSIDEHRDLERRSTKAAALTGRRARLREAFLDGDPDALREPADAAGMASVPDDGSGGNARGTSAGSRTGSEPERVSHADAARLEADA
ncbi:MAG: hypothetical protein QOC74_4167, partial [Pseudonocardiales bacterium]|nr:hypothetical protein [Pseudonocardiales bacterium]